jgi:predicted nuclease of predicted toxin-antitoxin system
MRFLADAGLSPDAVVFLAGLGYDVLHVRAIGMQRASDRAIADYARTDARIVVTFDLDFGDILALGVLDRPSVILLRLSDERPWRGEPSLALVIAEQQAVLDSGALIVVEDSLPRAQTPDSSELTVSGLLRIKGFVDVALFLPFGCRKVRQTAATSDTRRNPRSVRQSASGSNDQQAAARSSKEPQRFCVLATNPRWADIRPVGRPPLVLSSPAG